MMRQFTIVLYIDRREKIQYTIKKKQRKLESNITSVLILKNTFFKQKKIDLPE